MTLKKQSKKTEMMTVTFTTDVEVVDHNGDIEFSAREGEHGPLPLASALRWIRRGKAVEGKAKAKPAGQQVEQGPKQEPKQEQGQSNKSYDGPM